MDVNSRLRWRCRRGIKEMDLLLERFMDDHYTALPDTERAAFESLLDEADLDILSWITGSKEPARPDYLPIIRRLQGITPT